MFQSKVALLVVCLVTLECWLDSVQGTREILVRGPNDQAKLISIRRNSTVLDLKKFIQLKFLIPTYNQKIISNGSELLNDSEWLMKLKIWRLPFIEVMKKSETLTLPVIIYNDISKSELGRWQVSELESISVLKERIFFTFGLYPWRVQGWGGLRQDLEDHYRLNQALGYVDEITLFIKGTNEHKFRVDLSTGGSSLVEVKRSDSVESFKLSIEKHLHIPIEDQQLYLDGVKLEDGKRLAEYQVWNHESIQLVTGSTLSRKITIISNNYYTFELTVKWDERVEDVRSMVADKLNLDKTTVHLSYFPIFSRFDLHDGTRLSDYIQEAVSSPVTVRIEVEEHTDKIKFSLMPKNGTNLVIGYEYDSILKLKERIQKNRKTSDKQIRLFLNDLELMDDKKVGDYKMYRLSNLKVVVEGIIKGCNRVKISTIEQEDFLDLEKLSNIKTILDLKMMIYDRSKYSIETQRLFYGGRELENDELWANFHCYVETHMLLATRRDQDYEHLQHVAGVFDGIE